MSRQTKSPTLIQQYASGTLKCCNCARCQRELVGESHAPGYRPEPGLPPLIAGRSDGRPYCLPCWDLLAPDDITDVPIGRGNPSARFRPKDENDEGLDPVVRAFEDFEPDLEE